MLSAMFFYLCFYIVTIFNPHKLCFDFLIYSVICDGFNIEKLHF